MTFKSTQFCKIPLTLKKFPGFQKILVGRFRTIPTRISGYWKKLTEFCNPNSIHPFRGILPSRVGISHIYLWSDNQVPPCVMSRTICSNQCILEQNLLTYLSSESPEMRTIPSDAWPHPWTAGRSSLCRRLSGSCCPCCRIRRA